MIRRINALLRDERGTSMTEFVMTIPIFITLFIGIMNLGRPARAQSYVTRDAATEMWRQVYQAEDDDLRMSARYEWAGLGSHDSWLRTLEAGYLGATGHWGHSRLYAQPMMFGLTGRTIPNRGDYGRMARKITSNPTEIVGNAHVATMMVNDTLHFDALATSMGGRPDSLGDIIGAVAGTALSISGAAAGFGAGIRYGQVDAGHTATVTFTTGHTRTLTRKYNALVSPTPDGPLSPEQRAFLVGRTSAEIREPYRNLLDFWRSTLPNERYSVPNF
ncbi:pilus assembly protein [Lujinxingia vulgaris]|uniref:Pilus assembly protein n=1 Tax=Lujinxingia vulgaris TaxID=2600176 RepID=A0A5C6XEX2_9DELT|nr:TadE family protein [Lujinxingia vulgaris]TXD35672.1 pilus assembly protein [Lujinxingia vulgaris]